MIFKVIFSHPLRLISRRSSDCRNRKKYRQPCEQVLEALKKLKMIADASIFQDKRGKICPKHDIFCPFDNNCQKCFQFSLKSID